LKGKNQEEKKKRVFIPMSSYKKLVYIKARIEQIKGDDVPMCQVVAMLIEEHNVLIPDALPKFEDSAYAKYF
jgi:hypothetical protein